MRWIFLRGLVRESRHWGGFPEIFREHVAGAEVIALDLPGNGTFHDRESPLTIGGMVSHCRRVLAARGLSPPFAVLALSLGGMVATEWASRHPGEIHACVLLNTSMRPFNPFFHRLQPKNYQGLLRLLFESSEAAVEKSILAMTSNQHGAEVTLLADWLRWRKECPVSRRNALRQLLAAARYRAPRQAPAVPLLLLASAGDRLVDYRCSSRIVEVWRSELAMHPTAGHDLPLDAPRWVAEAVAGWLASHALRA
ncbi:MAG: alpha/beta hydrolase [Rhodocyclaceae bacterium]